jgi:hypothetical protein
MSEVIGVEKPNGEVPKYHATKVLHGLVGAGLGKVANKP